MQGTAWWIATSSLLPYFFFCVIFHSFSSCFLFFFLNLRQQGARDSLMDFSSSFLPYSWFFLHLNCFGSFLKFQKTATNSTLPSRLLDVFVIFSWFFLFCIYLSWFKTAGNRGQPDALLADSIPKEQPLEQTDSNRLFWAQNYLVGPREMHLYQIQPCWGFFWGLLEHPQRAPGGLQNWAQKLIWICPF